MNRESTDTIRIPAVILAAAALAGAVIGLYEIANTSIGWHLASGDWILSNRAFLRADPFSFTSFGTPWVDHEWLFQVGVATVHALGGWPGLVVVRALVVAGLAVLLLVIGTRCGLSPAAALVLSLGCVAAARGRFFVRPELVTLLIVPVAMWLYLDRSRRGAPVRLAALAAVMVVGANAHAGAVAVPLLLGGILAAEVAEAALGGSWRRGTLVSGFVALAVSVGALLVNPYGWRLLAVPVHLARLVGQPHIPNPEWISPTPAQAPVLYAAIVSAAVVLGLRERRPVRWILLVMASALALRHIRNIGIFFVLLPLVVSPALATWPALRRGGTGRRAPLLAVAAVAVLALSLAIAPWPRFGLGLAEDRYPAAACAFMDAEGLPQAELYNDVRFGGYLIHRYAPDRLVFQDDRNEIHEPLLRRIWEIFQSSDVEAWSSLLESHDSDTALVRYHPPIRVTDPAGNDLGSRGFSTLWFPLSGWALVYWDDVAMVFVRRHTAPPGLLDEHEYRAIRPDDIDHLRTRAADNPQLLGAMAGEAARALRVSPNSLRAAEILALSRP